MALVRNNALSIAATPFVNASVSSFTLPSTHHCSDRSAQDTDRGRNSTGVDACFFSGKNPILWKEKPLLFRKKPSISQSKANIYLFKAWY
jgi:hypothetical protein